jgi:hypothetical protein
MFHYGEFIRMLWIVSSHGEIKTNLAPNTPEDYVNQVMACDPFDGSPRFFTLQQVRYRGQRYIDKTWMNEDEEELYIKVDPNTEYGTLLFFESLRQQITARKGFICPFNKSTRKCNCSKQIRSQLLRLSHLAVDGLFGKGEWFLLPCRR